MKPKWIDEVTEIVRSDAFAEWYDDLERTRSDLKRTADRHDELLTQVNLLEFRGELAHRKAIDTLEDATELEHASAELANRAAELENASFEVVSQFEMQRERTTEKWQQLGALDIGLENDKRLKRKRDKLAGEYEREDQRKQRLWGEVERLWVRSIDCNLALREKQHKAKIIRSKAEALFLDHEAEATKASKLKLEAEKTAHERERKQKTVQEAEDRAREQFECLLGEDFLYWVAREDNKIVYAVSLIDSEDEYSVPLKPGQIYRCSPTVGIDELTLISTGEEGAAESGAAEGDESETAAGEAEAGGEGETAGEDGDEAADDSEQSESASAAEEGADSDGEKADG